MSEPAAVLERLLGALNSHDPDGLVSCFAEDYLNETPAHPLRGFRGREQVRRNWTRIFAGVPDICAEVLSHTVDGRTLWTEWEMSGTRSDRTAFLMRGVVVFEIADGTIASARFYLEPVDEGAGGIDAATRRVITGRTESEGES